jgi:uncharacterized membrane protein (UPF0127 family)
LESSKRMKIRKYLRIILALFPCALLLSGQGEGILGQEGGKAFVQLTVKEKKIKAEVARTEDEKSRGLMFREKLGPDEGMLFIYGREELLSFWMKNTPLPLSIAFLDRNGRIVDLQDMEPFNLRTHTSARPAKYALEMNRNWFQKNGVKVGDVVRMPPSFTK